MAKKIYPGNWVNTLSSYQGQPVVALPGRTYFHKIGYALVGSTGAASFGITIPSPDRRADDKPRADISSLIVPAGACVYHVGIRVPDMRKDRAIGDATSGIVGTNTNRLKIGSAVNTAATGAITTTVIGTDSSAIAIASTTAAPTSATTGIVTPAVLTGDLTLSLWVTDNTGTAAGGTITSSVAGGTPIIAEVCYYVDDAAPELDSTIVPFVTET